MMNTLTHVLVQLDKAVRVSLGQNREWSKNSNEFFDHSAF